MTKYGEGAWSAKANERQKVRDRERQRFAAEAGVSATTSFADLAFAPAQQRKKMIGLLKVTRDGEIGGAQTDALAAMARALLTSGLGAGGPMAGMARSIISPHLTTSRDLLDHFSLDYDLRDRSGGR